MNWKSTKEAERKKRPRFNAGIVRIAIQRSMFLVSFFQACMIGYLFIEKRGWEWWYLIAPILFFCYAVFDRLVTYRQELSQNIINSEEFMGLINNVEDIKETLDKMKPLPPNKNVKIEVGSGGVVLQNGKLSAKEYDDREDIPLDLEET